MRYNIVVLITVLFKGVQHLTQIVMYGIQWCVPASFVNPATCTLIHNMKPVIFFSIFPHQFVLFSWFLSYCCDNYIIKHITMNQILHLILWCNAETETAFMSKNDLQRVRTWQFFWLNYCFFSSWKYYFDWFKDRKVTCHRCLCFFLENITIRLLVFSKTFSAEFNILQFLIYCFNTKSCLFHLLTSNVIRVNHNLGQFKFIIDPSFVMLI